MEKIEAVYLAPQPNGEWSCHDLRNGILVDNDISMSLDLMAVLARRVRTVFIESAYHVLASHGMFDLSKSSGVSYVPMDDGQPLVIMQDPPTICAYRIGKDTITVLDPGNYGMVISDGMSVQQMMAYRKTMDVHYWHTTAVATAMHTLAARCEHLHAIQWMDTIPADTLVRSIPMGGNCGAGYYGKCPGNAFHLYDIQGAYLGAATGGLPVRLLGEGGGSDCPPLDSQYAADVTVKTSHPAWPYRPSTEHASGRKLTYYPVGTFRTVLCGAELDNAVQRGCVVECHRWEKWDCYPVLAPYCDTMRSRIASCHSSIRSAVKTTALAGLGWFARKEKVWEASGQSPPHHGYCGDFFKLGDDGVHRYRSVAGSVMREGVGDYHVQSSPQIWAWIASSVRERLSSVLRSISGHAMYWDTDSVITDSRGAAIMERRQDYGVWGGWQKKGTARTMHVWGYRRYSFGDTINIGLPVSARDEAGGRYVWESPETWDEAMGNRHYPDGTIVQRGGRIRGTYDHGKICEDGRIVPWTILPAS